MFCSTIVPTIGRASLERTVQSVLDQSFSAESHELIVVNDSGKPLPDAAWHHDPRVTLLHTAQRERCVARNVGAAAAKGAFLHFLDDDDWLLPNGLATLHRLAKNSAADVIYGGTQLVDRDGNKLITLDHQLNGNCFVHAMAGEWIPLQSSLVRTAAFMKIGGYSPNTLVSEDVDLVRRLLLHGTLSGSAELVAAVESGQAGSSSQHDKRTFYSRRAREKILDDAATFNRLKRSAHSSYWQGRMVRIYATSALQNAKSLHIVRILSRLISTLRAGLVGWRSWVSADFWHAFVTHYESPTFARGFAAEAARTG